MFVGIAQIINALISGATFGPRPGIAPPPMPPPSSPNHGSYGAPYPGHADPRHQELARPVPPPDRR